MAFVTALSMAQQEANPAASSTVRMSPSLLRHFARRTEVVPVLIPSKLPPGGHFRKGGVMKNREDSRERRTALPNQGASRGGSTPVPSS